MKVCVIGLGYIGLPTSAMFANAGLEVVGVDKKQAIVDALNKGEILIEEKGLAEFIKNVVASGHLRATAQIEPADAFIIAVPTPIMPDKSSDMRFVKSATEDVATVLKKGDLVVLESTSPVGTVDSLMLPILEATGLKAGKDFSLGHSPERVIPGNILYELVNNHRVAGGIDEESADRIVALYKSFVKGEIYKTNARTAELCKLSENTFRDVNIAFANELAKICEAEDINVWELIEICNKHPRVNIHQPGPGVGGHCIAVDPWFIVEKEPALAKIIDLSRHTNDSMPGYTAGRIQGILEGNGIEGKAKIAVLGITYKPNVDDMRESPVVELIEILKEQGFEVAASDPFVGDREGLPSFEEAVKDADLVVLGVNHAQYKDLDFEALGSLVKHKLFFDTRNFISSAAAESAGFKYYLLGRKDK
ncbi:MAG: nucleotide sugar dehydrogenase [Firmicutes bacterium]|nr:nucleotide sugar dehydrogenase [Bacillota bacterium]